WQLIRRRAANTNAWLQSNAVELLGYNDDPATRDLLLKLLADPDNYAVFEEALASARRLWGRDSLEPDYAAVRNENLESDELDTIIRRLQEHGDARRMLEILPRVPTETAERLKVILLSRQPLPVAEAQTVVAGPDAAAAGVAAHLLGRGGEPVTGKAVAAALN